MLLRRLLFLVFVLLAGRACAQISPSISADAQKAMDQLAKEPFRAMLRFNSCK